SAAVVLPLVFFSPLADRTESAATALIEARLFALLNSERESRGLAPLAASPELTALAREHSRGMAETGVLSHLSPSGKTLGTRLAESALFYALGGENVAFSETYVPEFMHKALMDSPAHRSEILRPEYNKVGIGVVRAAGKGYYLTESFLLSAPPVPTVEAEAKLKRRINDLRAAAGLDPLSFTPEANLFARYHSERKAGIGSVPPPVRLLGEIAVDFITAGTLDLGPSELRAIRSPDFEDAGVGVRFARDLEHPGGAYFITVVLVRRNPFRRLKDDDLKSAFLAALNGPRLEVGLPPLALDSGLSKSADRTSLEILRGTWKPPAALPLSGRSAAAPFSIRSYITEDPALVPDPIKADVLKIGGRKIGLGLSRGTSEAFPAGAWWVTIMY
ncbi:MAG: hypothetical protein JW742_09090, partial [Candidatus Aminicenantes bacterium]|nr:hypothetical protein [Candidatus Aminicenantes bacterium]